MIHIVTGDSRSLLKQLPNESINCCVTSPPYFGLRDYGTASWTGGDAQCDHRSPDEAGQTTKPSAGQREHAGRFAGKNCHRCGAQRADSQFGLEKTPEAYVTELVDLFHEVHRALRDDGTLWLNLGDSYAGSWGNQGRKETRGTQRPINKPMMQNLQPYPDKKSNTGKIPEGSGLKPKDLIGIPWRVAFALQTDGWYLRQDIIWHKPNPMPESVQDRCTKAHEYIFLLSKSPKYFFDSKAMQEPANKGYAGSEFHTGKTGLASRKPRASGNKSHKYVTEYESSITEEHRTKAGLMQIANKIYETRNRRSVWTVSTKPFKEAHFATFPADLIEPCILAGCPEGGIVLDPFGGAGTTGLVAKRHNRKAILFELNPEYAEMARRRIDGS